MIDTALATAPENNVVVHAAAGTGKTWLLTSRIVRLLLEGSEPGAILAITFTRKAAGEIQQRVSERLLTLAINDEPALDRLLAEIGVVPDDAARATARGLYEKHLSAVHCLRTTTFHAFCQEVLRRFPLEADVPPGFELLETTNELEELALQNLDREASRNPSGALATALDVLLREYGVSGCRTALSDFLAHRSDWWAYTEDEPDPVMAAVARLRALLELGDEDVDVPQAFVRNPSVRTRLTRYAELLAGLSAATYQQHATNLSLALADASPESAFARIRAALLTLEDQPRALKLAVLEKQLGRPQAHTLTELQHGLCTEIRAVIDRTRRQGAWQVSSAWYRCGHALLQEYQRLKLERGALDFADLEWKTYRLLNREHHAEWVQYKLDQRIDHLLVDEFQDTNPTQWRLLLPLVQEMVAGDPERRRSVFLVGDEKQSIYRFRRADPRLFHNARDWLRQHAEAHTLTQHISWRSSPAVIEFVNLVFSNSDDNDHALPDFESHATHHKQLWGRAELLPLVRRQFQPEPTATWRNPLQQPRQSDEDVRHRTEAELIVSKIRDVLGHPVVSGGAVRPATGDDVMILLRDRGYARFYEEALQRAGIPYIGTGKGAFLEFLEVRDLMHLLRQLLEPYNDLALASVLRSPLFAATETDLLRLAEHASGSWREALASLSDVNGTNDAFARARRLLPIWSAYAGRLPVHDLLDRIFCQGDVLARYKSASPPHVRARVEANLNRFLELALEMDSGRYPSLARFLTFIESHADAEDPAPEKTPGRHEPRIRIMTIHAAKGLEAPIVFLADAARGGNRDRGVRALIDWPVEHERPRYFHVSAVRSKTDDINQTFIEAQRRAARREETNLLYVALTRAAQMLFVSGCEPGKGDRGWYGYIEHRLREAAQRGTTAGLVLERILHADGETLFNTPGRLVFGDAPSSAVTVRATAEDTAFTVPPALTQPIAIAPDAPRSAPSQTPDAEAPDFADIPAAVRTQMQTRGVAIHRMLERLTADDRKKEDVEHQLRREFGDQLHAGDFERWWREVCVLVEQERWRDFFDPSRYREARNEVTILYREGEREVFGVVDRLIVRDHDVVVIDYKTHAEATPENAGRLALSYREQMRQYGEGVRRIWPGKKLRLMLFFTACGEVVELNSDQTDSA